MKQIREKKFSEKLLDLRKKLSATQSEIAPYFDLKLRMYQRYENGETEPEGILLGKYLKRIEELSRLDRLPIGNSSAEATPKILSVQDGDLMGVINFQMEQLKSMEAKLQQKLNIIEQLSVTLAQLSSGDRSSQHSHAPT